MDKCKLFPTLELEDKLVCDNYRLLDNAYKKNNSVLNEEYLYVPCYYKQNKRFVDENNVLFPQSSRLCDKEVVLYRGQNNVIPQTTSFKKTEFLIPHCDCDSYQNWVICDREKCCSKRHQLFMNMTKRQGHR